MAALGAVGVFARAGDNAGGATLGHGLPLGSPYPLNGGANYDGNVGKTIGDSGVARGGAMYIGQAVQAASTR